MPLNERFDALFYSRVEILRTIDRSMQRYSLTHDETLGVLDGIRDTLVRTEERRIRANAAARRRRADKKARTMEEKRP